MKPTNTVCVTKAGLDRKVARLISTALKAQYPDLYEILYNQAMEVVQFDQINPFSRVVDATHGTRPSPALQRMKRVKREQCAAAIQEGLIPRLFPTSEVTINLTKEN